MRSVLRSTIILSSSSFVNILVGLVSAKIWALLLGPSGIGHLGLMQGLLGLVALIAGLGIGAGLVSMGANALAQDDHLQAEALRRGAWLLFWAAGGLAVLALAMFRVPISRWMLGGPEHAMDVLLVGLALVFSLASGIQTSLLNAYHRVAALARVGVFGSILGTGASLVAVLIWREQAVALSVIAGAAINWGVSTYFVRREMSPVPTRPAREEVTRAIRSLLRFGAPYSASQMVGVGVQFILPAVILHSLSTESVGYYRAAISVAGVFLGFLLLAMAHDYYPRVSAVSDKPAQLVDLVNQQHRLIMLLAVPMILIMLAFTPYLVPLIYTPEFAPAVGILDWQLIGDLFKFSSWTMGFIILARRRSLTLFLVELVAGSSILMMSWLGIRWFGLSGLGIGYLATYVVQYAVTFMIVRKDIGLVWTTDNKLMLLATTVAVLVLQMLPSAGLGHLRMPLALSLGLLAGLRSITVIWKELELQSHVRAWLARAKSG